MKFGFSIVAVRPHRLYAMHRCNVLLYRRVCLCLRVGTRVSYAEMAEPIQIPLGGLTHVGPRNHVLDGSQDRTNLFAAARGDKTAMRLLPSYCGHLICEEI